jgi:hypothetical protein
MGGAAGLPLECGLSMRVWHVPAFVLSDFLAASHGMR